MSIADKIQRLEIAKTNIGEAIVAKGGTVNEGDGFEEFANDIGEIPDQVEADFTIEDAVLVHATLVNCTVRIPDGVVTIGKNAFTSDPNPLDVIMPNSVTTIEDAQPWEPEYGAFKNSAIYSIKLSSNLLIIGNFAFQNCFNLKQVEIPNSVREIHGSAFKDCESLENVILGDNIVSLGEQALYANPKLTSIILPKSIKTIENHALNSPFPSPLTDIYYTGTQDEWEQITFGVDAIPEGATIHYNYQPE